MANGSSFDHLVADLSFSERRELLRKIQSLPIVSDAPLFRDDEVPLPELDIDRHFRESPIFLRLYLSVLSIFKGKDAKTLFVDRLVDRLGAAIESKSPGLYSRKRGLLLDGFAQELEALKKSARFFYDALDGSVVRDKGAFFAFLASLELDVLHSRIVAEADPYAFAAINSNATDTEIRQGVLRALDSILDSISEDQRHTMYRNVRSLLCLKELSVFLFDRLLGSFSQAGKEKGRACPCYVALEQLTQLSNILYSMDYPPSLPLFESLFVFNLQDRVGDAEFDLDTETKALMGLAEEALATIRAFNLRVPLTAIVRCASRDLSFMPRKLTGGEDWFPVYRDYWRKQVEDQVVAFARDRKRDVVAESLSRYFKGRKIPAIEGVAESNSMEGVPLRSSLSLGFLAGFYRFVFLEEINKTLKTILLDGEFYKKENRVEFNDAYNDILKLGDSISRLETKLGPSGDYGQRYEQSRREITALTAKRRRLTSISMEADEESRAIILRSAKALRSLLSVLGGTVKGEVGGRYDSLSNLGSLGGSAKATFPSSIQNSLQKIEKAVQLLGDIESLESGR